MNEINKRRCLFAVFLTLLVACNRGPHSLVLRITSPGESTVKGTVIIDGQVQTVEYHAPTNLIFNGQKIVVRLEKKNPKDDDCSINYYDSEWANGKFATDMTNSVMKLDSRQRYFSLKSIGSRVAAQAGDNPKDFNE